MWEFREKKMCTLPLNDPGQYWLRVQAVSLSDLTLDEWSDEHLFELLDNNPQKFVLHAVISALVVLLIMAGLGIAMYINR